MTAPTPHRGRSLLFNLLARTTRRRAQFPYSLFWDRLYRRTRNWTMPVTTTIHNRAVAVSFNYSYPIFSRQFPELNNPLVELVHQTFLTLGRPLRVVDIGAAIGDTVLLIEANCPAMVEEYVCVDGDAEFFSYLEHNLSPLGKCRCLLQLLSSAHRSERSLVRTHGGTASAQGAATAEALSLDEVFAQHRFGAIDVVKIDVDGFDGEVLAGAGEILRAQQPTVIFEWHPALCAATGNAPFRAFAALQAAGYEQTVWFTKFGGFSHFGDTTVTDGVKRLQELCLRSQHAPDWHYDVVALPANSRLDRVALAEMVFARRRASPC